ncbi:MAG: DNA translocase FtsK [bacterium]|nr:DNA translocase FtsK [bacterium]
MSNKNRKKNRQDAAKWHDGLKPETKHSILAIIFLGLSLLFTLAAFGRAGTIGNSLYSVLAFIFGSMFFLVPVFFFIVSLISFFSLRANLFLTTIIGGVIFLLSTLGLADIIFGGRTGGYLGFWVSWPFLKFFDFWASLILFAVFFIIGILIMFNIPLRWRKKEGEPSFAKASEGKEEKAQGDVVSSFRELLTDFKNTLGEKGASSPEAGVEMPKVKAADKEEMLLRQPKKILLGHFHSPPLDIFEGDRGKPSSGDIKANANIIRRTLEKFGINVEMGEVTVGPSVTQYTLKPAEGMKLSRITALQNDLSLVLAAHPIRIEAPIPGKSLVGIEIPNSAASLVGLHNLFAQEEFRKSERPLLLALGRNVAGQPVYADLTQMPHLLIAGATGSGKSVAIHALMCSLLFRNPPENLRLLLIDPKRVELTVYNDLPHLMTPVITEAKKAISALKWLTKEMERRYDVLLEAKVRDIGVYHRYLSEMPAVERDNKDIMPYIAVIIDELADIMATYPREFEASIVRLAQMSRAVGIHLVLSTQRPSVEVLTGLIKANITSRIAFQVATQVDARTILDMAGAEKLLGNGDMLFLAGDTGKPRRVQGAFVSEKEINRLVKYLSEEYEDADVGELEITPGEIENSSILDDESAEIDDELYENAREIVIQAGKASSSYLQRRLKIGYARAARLLDIMEEKGVVGPGEGAKPREVYIKPADEEEGRL